MHLSETYSFLEQHQEEESSVVQALQHFAACPTGCRVWAMKALAYLYVRLSRYQESSVLFEEVLNLLEASDSLDIVETTDCLAGLGFVRQIQAHFHEAESAYLRSISLTEQTCGHYCMRMLRPLMYLGGLYRSLGQFHKSGEILQRAQIICDSLENPRHPYWGMLYGHLGQQYMHLGKYDEALEYLRQSSEIKGYAVFKDTEGMAANYLLMGSIELEKHNYQEAISNFNRGYELCESIPGGYQIYKSTALIFLARSYMELGDYDRAHQNIDSALSITAASRGIDSPHYGIALLGKGEILNASGRYDQAREYFQKSLAVFQKHYDPYHQRPVNAIDDLARTCCSMGEIEEGHRYYREFLARRMKFIEYAFSFSSDEQKLRWVDSYPIIENSFISLALDQDRQSIIRDACLMILRGKGIVIDALATQNETAYCTYDSTVMTLVGRLRETNETIAALASITKYHDTDIYRKDTVEVLYRIKDSLENELSHRCSQFSDLLASLRFDLEDVTEALSPGELLLEFIRYTPFDFKGAGSYEKRNGAPRYAVFIVPGRGDIQITDLGPADEIDSLIHISLDMVRAIGVEVYTPMGALQELQLRQFTGKLYNLILAPVQKYLRRIETIFISPDGALNLIPLEILPDSDSTYIIEHFHLRYLSSGRDLIRTPSDASSADPYALIVADPELDLPLTADSNSPSPSAQRSSDSFDNCLTGEFNPLPYSRYEATEIAAYFQASQKLKAIQLIGPEASEQALKNLAAPPRVLHLAAHGVFCGSPEAEGLPRDYNPMLRAGLALAGANSYRQLSSDNHEGIDDGILYALEIATLNLRGTELAVLSACETGAGEVLDGEGVFGLRRAFQQAGVQAIVMSLWTVPDRETSLLMSGFYKRWLEGASKAEALRQSALQVLKEQRLIRGNGHPYYWGGFILVGHSE